MEAATPAPPPPPPPPAAGSGASDYPVRLEAQNQGEYNRFLPLIKWLLAFPHYIALLFVLIGAAVVLLIAFFATIFTGRWPRGMFDYVAGTFRWTYRVYGYVYLLTDRYPPFSLGEEPDYPIRDRDRVPRARRPLAAAGPLAADPAVRVRRRSPAPGRGHHRLHRRLRDPVHGEVAPGPVQPDRQPPALDAAREHLPRLDGHPLPAVGMGGVSRHRTGRRNCQPRADQPEARRGAIRPGP